MVQHAKVAHLTPFSNHMVAIAFETLSLFQTARAWHPVGDLGDAKQHWPIYARGTRIQATRSVSFVLGSTKTSSR